MRISTILIACLVAVSALAEDGGVTVKLGGTVFGEYTITEPDTRPSSFQITRAYVNVTGNVTPQLSFRFTPDIARESGSGSSLSGSQTFRLKYAYAQYTRDRLWVRAGVQQTPYLDSLESLYRYRFQGTLFAEREGFITSSDAGITARYAFANDRGDIHAGYYNGEGYARAETNDQKAFQIRGTYRPTKQLRFTGFAVLDHADADRPRRRFIAAAVYEHARGNAGVEYLTARDQAGAHGFSAWATPRFTKNIEALLRFDSLQSANKTRDIAGISYWFPTPKGSSAAILFDRDHTRFGTGVDDTRYGAHLLLTF